MYFTYCCHTWASSWWLNHIVGDFGRMSPSCYIILGLEFARPLGTGAINRTLLAYDSAC